MYVFTHTQVTKKVNSESFANRQYMQTQVTINCSKMNLKVT